MRLPRIESRALKYGYSNARVKAMKGLLLDSNFLNDLVRVQSIDAMIELLQRTGYKNDLVSASTEYSGSKLIELAASRNFARVVQKLLKLTPKEDVGVVRALLVKWDLMNLKTLMHAKRLKRSYEEARPYLFPVGGLGEDDFRRIMKAEERDVFREVKRTPLGEQMLSTSTAHFSKQMWETFKNAMRNLNAFMQMETIVDAYTYLLMDKALADVKVKEVAAIREILKKEIDAKNIMIIERMKKHRAEKIKDSLIKGGTLNESLLNRVIEAKDTQAVVALVRSKFPQLTVKEAATLTDLEIAFEKSIAAQKVLAFHRAIMSVGVIIGFLLLKEEEINNLRKIAKGKEFQIPENEVREMLVIV